MLPSRPFVLPGPLGWIANLVGIAYVVVTTILFVFPPTLPVTGVTMNYCIVAFFIILVISTVQWFVDGRKNYRGPRIEMVEDHVEHGGGIPHGHRPMEEVGELESSGISELGGHPRIAELDA